MLAQSLARRQDHGSGGKKGKAGASKKPQVSSPLELHPLPLPWRYWPEPRDPGAERASSPPVRRAEAEPREARPRGGGLRTASARRRQLAGVVRRLGLCVGSLYDWTLIACRWQAGLCKRACGCFLDYTGSRYCKAESRV